AEAAPEIELPAQVEANLPVGEIVDKTTAGRREAEAVRDGLQQRALRRRVVGGVLAEIDTAILSGRLLSLREEGTDRDRLLCPGLEKSRSHSAKSQVLLVSGVNEGVEDGILEDVPPVAVAQVMALDSGILGLDPFGGHGSRGTMIVGPDLETVLNPGTG